MSFFNKLFGGDEKKETKEAKVKDAPKPKINEVEQKRIKMEAAANQLDTKIEEFEDKERKFEQKIEVLKNKAKENLADGKKREAKKYAEEATRLNKHMEVTRL